MLTIDPAKEALLDAILAHVPFDGWSEAAFRAAVADSGTDPAVVRTVCPRGALDLAVAYHQRGDQIMRETLNATNLTDMKIRERVTFAVRTRIEAVSDKEAVRRGSALFALPQHAGEGAKLIWGTADAIWLALDDPSDDINWYTKRATLSGVYGAVVLFWLGDDSLDHHDTWAFLDRRIEDVMRIEKVKAQVRDNPVLSKLLAGPMAVLGRVKAPSRMPPVDLPGHWTTPEKRP